MKKTIFILSAMLVLAGSVNAIKYISLLIMAYTGATAEYNCPVGISQCGNCGIMNQVPGGGYITYTVISDGLNDLAVCSSNGNPLYYDQFESFSGLWSASYYSTISNLTGFSIKAIFIVNGAQYGSPVTISDGGSTTVYGNNAWTLSDNVQLVLIPA